MTEDIQQLRNLPSKDSPIHEKSAGKSAELTKEEYFILKRENYELISEKKRLQLELEVLKGSADGGEARLRERQHYQDLLSDKDGQIMDLKDRLIKRDLEVDTYKRK